MSLDKTEDHGEVASPDEAAALLVSLLTGGHTVRFRARGKSMRPFIHDGDILTIVPEGPSSLRRGDIAFYQGPGQRLLAHRVLAIRRRHGRTVFLLRGDAFTGQLDQIDHDGILGKVVSIRRGSRTFAPHTPWWRGFGLSWARYQTVQAVVRIRFGRMRRWLRSPSP
jgi:hypothetical protein